MVSWAAASGQQIWRFLAISTDFSVRDGSRQQKLGRVRQITQWQRWPHLEGGRFTRVAMRSYLAALEARPPGRSNAYCSDFQDRRGDLEIEGDRSTKRLDQRKGPAVRTAICVLEVRVSLLETHPWVKGCGSDGTRPPLGIPSLLGAVWQLLILGGKWPLLFDFHPYRPILR